MKNCEEDRKKCERSEERSILEELQPISNQTSTIQHPTLFNPIATFWAKAAMNGLECRRHFPLTSALRTSARGLRESTAILPFLSSTHEGDQGMRTLGVECMHTRAAASRASLMEICFTTHTIKGFCLYGILTSLV